MGSGLTERQWRIYLGARAGVESVAASDRPIAEAEVAIVLGISLDDVRRSTFLQWLSLGEPGRAPFWALHDVRAIAASADTPEKKAARARAYAHRAKRREVRP